MEDAKLARPIDARCFNHTDVQHRLCVLADEEDDERTRDRRDDERDERIENLKRLRNLIKTDESELTWDHHHDEHEDEHHVFPFEIVERKSERCHRREIT